MPGGCRARACPVLVRVRGRCIILSATLLLFHLGNAAMLPLLGQAIVRARRAATRARFTGATVIVAQLHDDPDGAGRSCRWQSGAAIGWCLLLALIALPIRGLQWPPSLPSPVRTCFQCRYWMALAPGCSAWPCRDLVARILAGTGHVNAGLGVVMTVQGFGAALSPDAWRICSPKRAGYSASFFVLGSRAPPWRCGS